MGTLPALTFPARISAFSRERDSSATCAARTRSSRVEPSSPATVTSSLRSLLDVSSKDEPILQEFCMTETVATEPTPEQAALFPKVAPMMLIRGPTPALAVAAVLIAIGYRLFRSEGSAVATD